MQENLLLSQYVEKAAWRESCASGRLTHRIRLPDGANDANRIPTVVMLHGWCGDEEAMWIFSRLVPLGVAIVTPRAPIDLPGRGAIWARHDGVDYQPDTASLAEAVFRLERFLACLPQMYPVDPARMVLMGFSQGAMVSNALILTRPNKIIGVASLAGAAPPLPNDALHVNALTGLSVFIAHGKKDTFVPLLAARLTREIYTRAGADVTYNEYSTGHKMNTPAMKDLQTWLRDNFSAK
jgi:phospholipase/carboxylesterase